VNFVEFERANGKEFRFNRHEISRGLGMLGKDETRTSIW
jgi:hypothetical protein